MDGVEKTRKQRQPKTLKAALEGKVPKRKLSFMPKSFDTVGDILIINDLNEEAEPYEGLIAETLLKMHKNAHVVCKKVGKYSGTFRTPTLRIIGGERRKTTEHKENGVRLKLHAEHVYFSSRSSSERKRIAGLVGEGEEVLVMFSGCAPYPCVIAKNALPKEVVGVEMNPKGHTFGIENVQLNKLKNVVLYEGDVCDVVPGLKKKFDRIVMPLPKSAEDFLGVALGAAKKGTVIHFYDFLHEDMFSLAEEKVTEACNLAGKAYKILALVKCGQFGPGIFRICLDFEIL